MCLSLYIACEGQLAVRDHPVDSPPTFSIEEIAPIAEPVRQWFSLPVIRYIGTHTGCSCGFRHVVAAEPVEYWEGMFEYDDADEEDRRRNTNVPRLERRRGTGSEGNHRTRIEHLGSAAVLLQ